MLAAVAAVAWTLAAGLDEGGARGRRAALEGGNAVLHLVHFTSPNVRVDPPDVRIGDRLGLRITCPPGRPPFDVVVFDAGAARFPIRAGEIPCGERVPIPGGFAARVPGPLVACVALGEVPPRPVLASEPRAATVCVRTLVR